MEDDIRRSSPVHAGKVAGPAARKKLRDPDHGSKDEDTGLNQERPVLEITGLDSGNGKGHLRAR